MRRKPHSGHSAPARELPAPVASVTDHLFGEAISLREPAKGYRVTVDTLILAAFAVEARPRARWVMDLGAGAGALTLAVAHLGGAGTLTLVEREPPLCDLARENLALAGREGSVLEHDLEHELPQDVRGVADLVVCNPPFYAPQGDRALDLLRQRARAGSVLPFLRAASAALRHRGTACFVYPAPALTELLGHATAALLVAKRLRMVHAFSHSPARIVLVEFRRAKPGGLVVLPPLVEWDAVGRRSPALTRIVEGRLASEPLASPRAAPEQGQGTPSSR